MDRIADVFNDDAFSVLSLTAAINEMSHVPGRAGELVFAGIGEGIPTTAVAIEREHESSLSLIPTSLRGAPAPTMTRDKRSMLSLAVPQIKLEDTLLADSLQNVREFGTNNLVGVENAVNRLLQKMARRHDLTLEHHRLGALRGVINDADGSVLVDLFTEFGVLNSEGNAEPETFTFPLDDYVTVGVENSIRVTCQRIQRYMRRKSKALIPSSARVWAFCGDEFFDKLLEHPSVKGVYDGYASAKEALGDSYTFGVFEFGGVFFENYYGTDDNSTVAIAEDEARFFFTGVPGLYAEYFAPADYNESVNTIGMPRYAKIAPDRRFNQYVEMQTQQNPLPICLRPETLVKGVIEPAT